VVFFFGKEPKKSFLKLSTRVVLSGCTYRERGEIYNAKGEMFLVKQSFQSVREVFKEIMMI
jgi:hypothetical protein